MLAGAGEGMYRTSQATLIASGELERNDWKLTFKSGTSYGGRHPPTLHSEGRRHSGQSGRGGESRGTAGAQSCAVASRTRCGLTNQDQESRSGTQASSSGKVQESVGKA